MNAPKALCSEFNLALYMSSKTLRLNQCCTAIAQALLGLLTFLLTRAQSRFWAFPVLANYAFFIAVACY